MALQIYKCTKFYFKGSYAEVKTAAYVVSIKVQTKVSVLFQILKVFVGKLVFMRIYLKRSKENRCVK